MLLKLTIEGKSATPLQMDLLLACFKPHHHCCLSVVFMKDWLLLFSLIIRKPFSWFINMLDFSVFHFMEVQRSRIWIDFYLSSSCQIHLSESWGGHSNYKTSEVWTFSLSRQLLTCIPAGVPRLCAWLWFLTTASKLPANADPANSQWWPK